MRRLKKLNEVCSFIISILNNKNDEALIFHINNPPVGEYVEKHLELAESIEIEIYGQLADDSIDILTQAWGEAKIPFKLFKTTRVGYFRQSIFG